MHRIAVMISIAILSCAVSAADMVDTPAARKEAAERYMRVADFRTLMDASLEAGVLSLPAEKRAEVVALAKKHIRYDVLEALVLSAMIKNFTTIELDALARFYGSPEGRSAMAKFGTYMADAMPILQTEMVRAVTAMQEEVSAKQASSDSGN
jgi:hypothetical protein